MPFDFENLNPSVRFYYGDEKEEWVDLRLASDEDNDKLRKQVGIKMRVEYQRDDRFGRLQRIEYVDANEKKLEQFAQLLNDFVIADWYLVTNKGVDIPCTTENKNKLMRGSPSFSDFVARSLEQLRRDVKEQEDRETKNSETTLSE